MSTGSVEYHGRRICGVEATLAIGEAVRKFINREIVYHIDGELPGLTNAALLAEFKSVTQHIASKCGATFFHTSERNVRPNIHMTFGQIDGAGKTLAWSELRNSEQWQVTQKHDNAERWAIASANIPPNRISWGLVALHETIHSMGAPHLTGGIAVMNPIYNANLTQLQVLDIGWLVASYGETMLDPVLPPPINETLLGNLYMDKNGYLFVRRLS